MKRVVLDTSVYLGMFYGERNDCNQFRLLLLYKENNLFIILCEGIRSEIFKKMKQKHLAFNALYQNIIIPLVSKKKIDENGTENNLPNGCNVSHKNDIHVIKCAIGSDCKTVITIDSRLEVNENCKVKIENITDYIN